MKKNEEETNDFANYDGTEVSAENAADSGEYYNESGFSGYKDNKSMMRLIIIGAAALVLVIVVIVVLVLATRSTKLTNLDVKVNDIIYVGEESNVELSVTGSGKLNKTNYVLSVDNDDVTLEKDKLSGASAKTTINASKLGSFNLGVKATADKSQLSKEQKIVVCSRLDEKAVDVADISLSVNGAKTISVNLGFNAECFRDVKYESSDTDIVEIDEYGTVIGVSTGDAVISISDNASKFDINVHVK